jgi:hypothetical protein
MEAKLIYITGVEGVEADHWWWYEDLHLADYNYNKDCEDFGGNCDNVIYRGQLYVPANLNDSQVTQYVQKYLTDNRFDRAQLLNKTIYNNGPTWRK